MNTKGFYYYNFKIVELFKSIVLCCYYYCLKDLYNLQQKENSYIIVIVVFISHFKIHFKIKRNETLFFFMSLPLNFSLNKCFRLSK